MNVDTFHTVFGHRVPSRPRGGGETCERFLYYCIANNGDPGPTEHKMVEPATRIASAHALKQIVVKLACLNASSSIKTGRSSGNDEWP